MSKGGASVMASSAIPGCAGHWSRVTWVMTPAPDSVRRKFPVLAPLIFSENAPPLSVVTVADEVATEMPASGCPPFVAVTAPENSETTGGGGGAGGAGVGGADGVAGEEEPQAETNPHRMTASTRFMVGPV